MSRRLYGSKSFIAKSAPWKTCSGVEDGWMLKPGVIDMPWIVKNWLVDGVNGRILETLYG